jgi:hypothetical protein
MCDEWFLGECFENCLSIINIESDPLLLENCLIVEGRFVHPVTCRAMLVGA